MKKLQQELNDLIEKYGYWSEQVKEFNGRLDFDTMTKLNNNISQSKK